MTILELAAHLKAIYDQHGDVPVMFTDPNSSDTFNVTAVTHRVVGKDEFPEEWNMPEGYEFVELSVQ